MKIPDPGGRRRVDGQTSGLVRGTRLKAKDHTTLYLRKKKKKTTPHLQREDERPRGSYGRRGKPEGSEAYESKGIKAGARRQEKGCLGLVCPWKHKQRQV